MRLARLWVCGLVLAGWSAVWAGDRSGGPTREEMGAVIEFLASDLLEGRAPGTRGGDLAEAYVKSVFQLLGLRPGLPGGGYLQPVPLRGYTPQALAVQAGEAMLEFPADVVGLGLVAGEGGPFAIGGPAVFAGFGIHSDIWPWDDFGDADLRGKFLLVRAGDPGAWRGDLFDGPNTTYFGRWTYKIEEAGRRGAAAILLIHTTPSAGYDWTVVRNSWAGEALDLAARAGAPPLFRGWIQEESLRRLLAGRGQDLDDLYARSVAPGFRPVELGFDLLARGQTACRDLLCHNVVAELPGETDQRIVLSAHIDHLGLDPGVGPDRVYNGAIDNGSAVAALVMAARVLAREPVSRRHTITFLGCHAEEAGLLGSRHYVETADRSRIVANINFESTPVWGRTRDMLGIGARYSTLAEDLAAIAADTGLRLEEFSLANQGLFFRSDQFSFARWGIPAVWLSAGEDDDSGQRLYTEFWQGDYHTVRDEFDPDWSLEALAQTVDLTIRLLDRLDRAASPPRWVAPPTFPLESGAERRVRD